jgi:hypothetical protein
MAPHEQGIQRFGSEVLRILEQRPGVNIWAWDEIPMRLY